METGLLVASSTVMWLASTYLLCPQYNALFETQGFLRRFQPLSELVPYRSRVKLRSHASKNESLDF